MDSLSTLPRRSASFALLLGAVSLATASCGGDVGPGDYQGYRIAATSPIASGTCTFDAQDTTTILDGTTIVLFAVSGADGEIFQLDIGGTVLKGYASETGFSFQGKATEVDQNGNGNGNVTITTNTTITISFDVDGSEVTNGKYSTKIEANCTAGDCANFDPVNCTRSSTFTGVAIDTGDVGFTTPTP